jgi:hypothetical protein
MRIRILLLIKVMKICDHWCIDPPGLHFEPPGLNCSVHGPPCGILNFDFLMRIQIQRSKIMRIRIGNPGGVLAEAIQRRDEDKRLVKFQEPHKTSKNKLKIRYIKNRNFSNWNFKELENKRWRVYGRERA